MKKKPPMPKNEKLSKIVYKKQSIDTLRLHYRFLILFGVLVLAAVCIVLRIETPGIWAFLGTAGGWAVLSSK